MDYKWILLAGAVLFLPSLALLAIYPGAQANACGITGLCGSASTPWGAISSLFLYDGWTNVLFFIGSIVLFFELSLALPNKFIKKRVVFATISMFAIGIGVNVLQIVFVHGILYYGPSGVLYAFFGLIFGFAILDTLESPFRVKLHGILDLKSRQALSHFVVNVIILLMISGWIYIDTGGFLSKAPNVDYAAHGMAFLGGMIVTLVFGFSTRHLLKKSI